MVQDGQTKKLYLGLNYFKEKQSFLMVTFMYDIWAMSSKAIFSLKRKTPASGNLQVLLYTHGGPCPWNYHASLTARILLADNC